MPEVFHLNSQGGFMSQSWRQNLEIKQIRAAISCRFQVEDHWLNLAEAEVINVMLVAASRLCRCVIKPPSSLHTPSHSRLKPCPQVAAQEVALRAGRGMRFSSFLIRLLYGPQGAARRFEHRTTCTVPSTSLFWQEFNLNPTNVTQQCGRHGALLLPSSARHRDYSKMC